MVGKKNKVELELFLKDFVDKVSSKLDVDEILLFGSYAKGTETDESDIDIAVISSELSANNLLYENTRIIKNKTKFRDPYLQLLGFESKSFYSEDYIDPGFIREIKRTGKTLFKK